MQTCLSRIRKALSAPEHKETLAACIATIENIAPVLSKYHRELGLAVINQLPTPSKPRLPKSALDQLSKLTPAQRAVLHTALKDIHEIWSEEYYELENLLDEQEEELSEAQFLDSTHGDAVECLIEKLEKLPMSFGAEQSIRDTLRKLYKPNTRGLGATLKFLKANFSKHSSDRNLACYLHGLVALEDYFIAFRGVNDDPKREKDLVIIRGYIDSLTPSPLDWYLNVLPQLDGWSLHLGDELTNADETTQNYWTSLLEHLGNAKGKKPTKAYADSTKKLFETLPADFTDQALELIENSIAKESVISVLNGKAGKYDLTFIHESNFRYILGMIWTCEIHNSQRTPTILERILDKCFTKIPGCGPLNEMLGQASIDALLRLNHESNTMRFNDQLMKHKKNKNLRKRIEKAIAQIS